MAVLSLIEFVKTATDPVMSGVVENIITIDQLIGALPYVSIGANDHINFDREKALPTTSRPSSGATITADNALEYDRVSAYVRRLVIDQDIDVLDAGVVPTPAVAFLTAEVHADFGVMLSASHNAMPDNGIKFFASGGLSLIHI